MNEDAYPADPARNQSKWEVLAEVLPRVLRTYPPNHAVGITRFRYDPSTGCQPTELVGIAPLSSEQLLAIGARLAAEEPTGWRPTPYSWEFAHSVVADWPDPGGYVTAPRRVILVTDGSPTVGMDCALTEDAVVSEADYERWIASVERSRGTEGVETFVIGIPGSELPTSAPYDPLYMLSRVAIAGATPTGACIPTSGVLNGRRVDPRGTYCHLDTTESQEFGLALEEALREFAPAPVACSVPVPSAPRYLVPDPQALKVVITTRDGVPRDLRKATSDRCLDGEWYVSGQGPSGIPVTITLCPAACDGLQVDHPAAVRVEFRCLGAEL
jgi:hypothetical protein